MKQIIKDKNLLGKTVKRTGYTDNAFILFFTDNTFAVFRGCGYDEWDVELRDEPYSLKPTVSNALDLCGLGIITKEEYDKIHRDNKASIKLYEKQKELEEYERLKLKFDKTK